jgi:hypothetical protein
LPLVDSGVYVVVEAVLVISETFMPSVPVCLPQGTVTVSLTIAPPIPFVVTDSRTSPAHHRESVTAVPSLAVSVTDFLMPAVAVGSPFMPCR